MQPFWSQPKKSLQISIARIQVYVSWFLWMQNFNLDLTLEYGKVWRKKYTEENGSCSIFPYNKPGTAQVGAISKAQKDSKTTFSATGDNKSSQKTKN